MSLLEAARAQNAGETSRFASYLGAVLHEAVGPGDATEAFRYFWDETPEVESAFGLAEFPNLRPPGLAPLFLEGEGPRRPVPWAVPLRDGRMAAAPDAGLGDGPGSLGALFWEEGDEIAEEELPEEADTALAVAVWGRTGPGNAPLAPAFYWRIAVGTDGRAKRFSGGEATLMVDETRRAAAGSDPEALLQGNRDALYIALFALCCANARYDGEESDLHGASLHIEDLVACLDRAGAREFGVGHAMAACSHLFAPADGGEA